MPPPKGLVKKLEKTGDLVKAPSRKGDSSQLAVLGGGGVALALLLGGGYYLFGSKTTAVSVGDTATLKRVFYSGEPWLIECSTSRSATVVREAEGELKAGVRTAVLNCHEKLPSGLSTLQRFKLSAWPKGPTVLMAANLEKPQVAPPAAAASGGVVSLPPPAIGRPLASTASRTAWASGGPSSSTHRRGSSAASGGASSGMSHLWPFLGAPHLPQRYERPSRYARRSFSTPGGRTAFLVGRPAAAADSCCGVATETVTSAPPRVAPDFATHASRSSGATETRTQSRRTSIFHTREVVEERHGRKKASTSEIEEAGGVPVGVGSALAT